MQEQNLYEFIENTLLRGVSFSDIQLNQGEPVKIRTPAGLVPAADWPVERGQIENLVKHMTHIEKCDDLLDREGGQFDFGAKIGSGDGTRFRCNLYYFNGRMLAMSMRINDQRIPTVRELGLPESVLDLVDSAKGMLLVTGPTGSGKSTTLAALVNWINERSQYHIVTVEDPIEIVHKSKMATMSQREVGHKKDTESFAKALRAALRQQPDVIMVGELRDLETTEIALTAAETGHLVLATLHTVSAERTINRILSMYPPDARDQARDTLASVLLGVISQVLIKSADGLRKHLAYEIMINNTAISTQIREDKIQLIRNSIRGSQKDGAILLNDMLKRLVRDGKITPESAKHYSYARHELEI